MNSIKNIFYSESPSDSVEQLRMDFGEFPPNGISPDFNKIYFKVIYLNEIGDVYYSLNRLFFSMRNPGNLSRIGGFTKLEAGIKELKSVIKNTKFSVNNIKTEIDKLHPIKKIIAVITIFLLLFLLTPLLIPIVVYLAYKIIKICLVSTRAKDSFGYFNAALGGRYEIVVKPKKIIRADHELSGVVSHEHLHMLQNFNRSKKEKFLLYDTKIKKPDLLLNEKNCKDAYFLYLLDSNELEARLHELVLSFYRKHKTLPGNISDFHFMIATNQQFYNVLQKLGILESFNMSVEQLNDKLYDTRNFIIGVELEIIISCLKDRQTRVKFINEVLTVMYGNLLAYYGDSNASVHFLKQIPGPTLYDRLYEGNPGYYLS